MIQHKEALEAEINFNLNSMKLIDKNDEKFQMFCANNQNSSDNQPNFWVILGAQIRDTNTNVQKRYSVAHRLDCRFVNDSINNPHIELKLPQNIEFGHNELMIREYQSVSSIEGSFKINVSMIEFLDSYQNVIDLLDCGNF